MSEIGLRQPWLLAASRPYLWGAFGVVAAAVPALWMWGFTVDDALISVRYARHLGHGQGWRFNGDGPATDGVTPLPWPLLLVPLSWNATALEALLRARMGGLVVWVSTGALVGWRVGRIANAAPWVRGIVLVTMALSVPLAAYPSSGMETVVATLLTTSAVASLNCPWRAAFLGGLAATLRPELAPWACALALGASWIQRQKPAQGTLAILLSLAPSALCALVRWGAFGRPAPLSLLAKPSDVAHGVAYAGAALVVAIVPVLLLAPISFSRTREGGVIGAAAIVHVLSIVVVGGDWMPYARLIVPVVPSMAIAAAFLGAVSRPWASVLRGALALSLGLALFRGSVAGRPIAGDREILIARARPWLAGIVRVATLDIGWVSAATEADIVDLAGVTDPDIAVLPGGHTSKGVSAMFLLRRDPGALLLFAPAGVPGGQASAWRSALYTRRVEARLASDDVVARHFAPIAFLPLGANGGGYVLLRRTF